MAEKVDKDVQVDDSNLPLVSYEIEEYKNKKKNLESMLDKMHQVSITVEKFMKETDEELRLAEDMKKSRMDRQIYKQRNMDLREENEYMKEYIKLREEKDELELDIMEMEMKKKHRLSYLESRYLINMNQCQNFQAVTNPQPVQQLQIQQSIPPPPPNQQQSISNIPAPNSNTAPPPPPPPPVMNTESVKKQKDTAIAPPASHNTVKPNNINDELKSLLSNKFKNANPDE